MTAVAGRVDRQSVAAVAGVPALLGVVALADGYPLPASAAELAAVALGGVTLAVLGALARWWVARGLRVAPGLAGVAVVAGAAWALAAPGVTAARTGSAVVVAGDPALSRFVGAVPLVVLACGAVALAESRRALPEGWGADATDDPPRTTALAAGGACAAALALLALAPGYLLGTPLAAPALVGFAVAGAALVGVVAGYLRLRQGVVLPPAAVAVVAAAAAVAVTAGGSPRGFPTAWPVWGLPALALGVLEGGARWAYGRVAD